MTDRVSAITDWRTRDEDLPEIPPGGEYERRIAPQKYVVLLQVSVRNLTRVRLRVGAADGIPFKLTNDRGGTRNYRPRIGDSEVVDRLAAVGAAALIHHDEIRIPPGMDVLVTLRNDDDAPAKPRVALLVQESDG